MIQQSLSVKLMLIIDPSLYMKYLVLAVSYGRMELVRLFRKVSHAGAPYQMPHPQPRPGQDDAKKHRRAEVVRRDGIIIQQLLLLLVLGECI